MQTCYLDSLKENIETLEMEIDFFKKYIKQQRIDILEEILVNMQDSMDNLKKELEFKKEFELEEMGEIKTINTALITWDYKTAIYLHWNGGYDSVNAFLTFCKLSNCPVDDYGVANFVRVVSNFFSTEFSCGVGAYKDYSPYADNGIYICKFN